MRRKPIGAIVAWGSLAVFAVLTIMGIAGMVMGLQAQPVATARIESAAMAPEPVLEERLPAELSFAEAKAAETEPQVPIAEVQVAEVRPAEQPAPEPQVIDKGDAVIASTFEQLVKPVVVSESEVPEGAIATVKQPAAPPVAEEAVASAEVELPMRKEEGTTIVAQPRTDVARNAAAWAIESEVPDEARQSPTALGYAAEPEDDAVHVGDSSVNVRSGPSQKNKRLFALAAGAEVDVDGKSGGWVSITDSKGRDGWVDASLLDNLKLDAVPEVKEPSKAEPEKSADVKKVTGSGVTVRSGPGKSNKQLFNLAAGSEVTVLDDSKGWLKITDAKGRTGWAYKDYIK